MTDRVQMVAIVISTVLVLTVLELIRRRKLSEEYSFIWLVCAAALLVLSVMRRYVDLVALWLGIYYPPALLILVLMFFVFVASLYFALVISRQREQIERLIEDVAILSAIQRDRNPRRLPAPGEREGRPDASPAASPPGDR
jgi:hypothetical protein